ncbi:hypothetical protein IQ266_00810 [filamentous cyanobacterium LEGE 11480]|uniref:Uncharacterized protein n=1 Tax=Romeriopsis navalis LEGE 11480 TaxID=2777977 RepID=A0A928Z2D8_9CYAN|nr:hypothetical protein [Romeriopsis navalis]MBE9028295.1 hypothetical protein [Romeriopsis navalis LEGE 11480]
MIQPGHQTKAVPIGLTRSKQKFQTYKHALNVVIAMFLVGLIKQHFSGFSGTILVSAVSVFTLAVFAASHTLKRSV